MKRLGRNSILSYYRLDSSRLKRVVN
eukprot:COSAG02_NODE_46897_length_345_cov_0.800813_1_plen_25_part_10